MSWFKKLFSNVCPECEAPLTCDENGVCCTKMCPHGHYKEETYCSLGVSIVYDKYDM